MAQSSTIIQNNYSYKSDAIVPSSVINFVATGNTYQIMSTDESRVNLTAWAPFDLIQITGSNFNNKIFTVLSVASSGTSLTVAEPVTTEINNGGTVITLTPYGVITDQYQGAGYYNQPGGFHTVAYNVNSETFSGSIKMQATLEMNPTYADWFDVENTTFTFISDGSTVNTATSYNFIGNFVWVRAMCYNLTAGSISYILYNH
jgi:hypothetical protein